MADPAPMTPAWHAVRTPDAPAIIMGAGGEVVTYAQLDARSVAFAQALRSRGLGPGDQIAVLMENNRAYLEVTWAAQRSGLRYTAINSHLRHSEVQYILDDCGATALVASASVADVVAGLDLARVSVRVSAAGDLPGFEPYEDVLAAAPPGPLAAETEGREMLYSSGTTGRPKGVRKPLPGTPFGDPASAPVQIANGLLAGGVGPGSVYLSPAPLCHGAPLVFSSCRPCSSGCCSCPTTCASATGPPACGTSSTRPRPARSR
jgi:long-chain acyl-CoA synthetase